MKKLILFSMSVLALTSSGCAHVHGVEGEQARSEIPEGVRVNIGGKEVRNGDRLNVFTNMCRKQQGPRGIQKEVCQPSLIGEARVLKVLDHDSAVVEPLNGLVMDSGMSVERK